MEISQLYTYPIKSLRGTSIKDGILTKHGFPYDRRFMLLKAHPDRSENMLVAHFPVMTLFMTDIMYPENDDFGIGAIFVTYKAPESTEHKKLKIPLLPDTSDLEVIDVIMHDSATKAFKMPSKYNDWFSSCFGYDVVLAYLGPYLRPVLFETAANGQSSGEWLSNITRSIPIIGESQEGME